MTISKQSNTAPTQKSKRNPRRAEKILSGIPRARNFHSRPAERSLINSCQTTKPRADRSRPGPYRLPLGIGEGGRGSRRANLARRGVLDWNSDINLNVAGPFGAAALSTCAPPPHNQLLH